MAIRAPTMPNDTDTAQSPGLPKPMTVHRLAQPVLVMNKGRCHREALAAGPRSTRSSVKSFSMGKSVSERTLQSFDSAWTPTQR